MTPENKELIRRIVRERLEALADSAPGDDERAPVVLDQQSVGRLSRMDAMQRQAMAQETARRRAAEVARLTSALARMDDVDFGYCAECGDEIPLRRLEIDPGAALCVRCASGG